MRLQFDVFERHVFHDGAREGNVGRSLAGLSEVRPEGRYSKVRSTVRGLREARPIGIHQDGRTRPSYSRRLLYAASLERGARHSKS